MIRADVTSLLIYFRQHCQPDIELDVLAFGISYLRW
jgi:hypothetical protein